MYTVMLFSKHERNFARIGVSRQVRFKKVVDDWCGFPRIAVNISKVVVRVNIATTHFRVYSCRRGPGICAVYPSKC